MTYRIYSITKGCDVRFHRMASSMSDSLSILNVEQLNNAVSLAHVLPLQPDSSSQVNQLTLPIQNASHTISVPLPRITVASTIQRNAISSGSIPVLMQVNTTPQGNQTLNQVSIRQAVNPALRQISFPVIQEQPHLLLPTPNVSSATINTTLLQPNNIASTERDTDITTWLSTANQINTLMHLNQVNGLQLTDNTLHRSNINNYQLIPALPVSITVPQPVLTGVTQSTPVTSSNRTPLLNLAIHIPTNHKNSLATVQPSSEISTASIGQPLQITMPTLTDHRDKKSNDPCLPLTDVQGFHFVTSTDTFESFDANNSQQQTILTQDPVAAASFVAGVTDDMHTDGSEHTSVDNMNITLLNSQVNDDEFDIALWCVECKLSHISVCPTHGELHSITDAPILSHARQTLPSSVLLIRSSNVTADGDGVFARESIAARSQFGPLHGKIVNMEIMDDVDNPAHWKIFRGSTVSHCIDASDEKVSNWMMLVRKARMSMEQNLVAYQWSQYIFFTTTRVIQPGEELLWWYCGNYAKNKGLKDTPEECFWCVQCNRQFVSASRLSRHIKYSHPDTSSRKFKCTKCSRAFLCLTKLNVHQMTHTNIKPHQCRFCSKTFTDPSNLRTHLLIHTDEKKFKCTQCNKAFRQKAHLVTHMVIHTGEKKLKCPQCHKLFSRQSDIKTHMYFHTKEKQAQCPLCAKVFWHPQQYKRHMQSHSREREHQCSYCKRTFLARTHLKRHEESGTCRKSKVVSSRGSMKGHRAKERSRNKLCNKQDGTLLPIAPSTDTQHSESSQQSAESTTPNIPDDTSLRRKRSMRILQRRRLGKVINYSADGTPIQETIVNPEPLEPRQQVAQNLEPEINLLLENNLDEHLEHIHSR